MRCPVVRLVKLLRSRTAAIASRSARRSCTPGWARAPASTHPQPRGQARGHGQHAAVTSGPDPGDGDRRPCRASPAGRRARCMFVSLRPHATDEQAKQSAIRRAGVVFHLNTSPAQDSPVPGQRPARPPEPGSRSPRLAPGGRAEGGPARQAAAASSTRSPARSATRAQSRLPARPEGTSPPAGWAPAADHQPSRSEGGAGHAAQPRRPQQARGQR
jgi:hypothetical protein